MTCDLESTDKRNDLGWPEWRCRRPLCKRWYGFRPEAACHATRCRADRPLWHELGTWAAWALAKVGITPEKFGRGCGCKKREAALNTLGRRWFGWWVG